MRNLAVAFAAAMVMPLVTAAPLPIVERTCNAIKFSPGSYSLRDNYVQVYTSNIQAEVGETLTATVVDLATCSPYTATDLPLRKLTGSAFDRDFVYLPEQGIPSSGNTVTGSNTVSWVAAVPNGSKNLVLSVTAQLTPGSLVNLQYASSNLGVVYTSV